MLEAVEERTVPTPVVNIAALSDANEGSMMAQVSARLTRTETSGWLVVNLSTSGTATAGGTDYYTQSTASFADGQATTDVNFLLNNDSTSEPTETVIISVASGTGYTIGSPSSATTYIFDNDAQYVSVAVEDAGEDGDNGAVGFTRIGDLSSTLTVNFSLSGSTATSGTDYTSIGTTVTFSAGSATAIKTITALPDNIVDDNETVYATVTSGTGYTVGSPSYGIVYINDDPPVISVSAMDAFLTSSAGGFTFSRTGGDISSALVVSYTISGTATPDTDYTELSGTVTFAADEVNADVPVDVLVIAGGTTVIATIDDGGSDYTIGDADEATVNILAQPLTVSVERLTDGEEGVSNASFRFIRYGDISEALVVDYTVSGTATSGGTDFTSLSGTVTFAADSDHTDVAVTLYNDASVENTETVTVKLDASEDYLLGNDSDTVYITDNDTRRIVWTGAVDGDWDTSGNWTTIGNSSEHEVPGEYDEVYFDGNVSDDDCTNLGDGGSDLTLKGVHLVGGYAGTVALAAPLLVSTYEQTSGTLDQPNTGYGLTIGKVMRWTGGALNSTNQLATVTITGSTAVARIAPASEGTVYLGSNITLDDGAVATLKAGTIEVTNDGMLLTIDANAGMKADAGPKKKPVLKKSDGVDPDEPSIALVGADSFFTVESGSFEGKGVVDNVGGAVTLNTGTELYLPGKGDVYGYRHSGNSKLILWAGSKLRSDKRVELLGGQLVTLGKYGETCNVQIECTTLQTHFGTTIKLARDPANFDSHIVGSFNAYGTLTVSGSVDWQTSVFQAYVPGDHNGWQGDLLKSSGEFLVGPNYGNNMTLPELQVVAFGDDGFPTVAQSGHQWLVIESKVEIKKVNNNAPYLDTDVWEIVTAGNPVEQWFAKAK